MMCSAHSSSVKFKVKEAPMVEKDLSENVCFVTRCLIIINEMRIANVRALYYTVATGVFSFYYFVDPI